MPVSVDDLEDQTKYRQIDAISYDDLVPFILDNLRKVSTLMVFFWSVCAVLLFTAIRIRFMISGYYPGGEILLHTALGLIVFPVVCIPVHEVLHIIPFYLTGARDIRFGADLRQFLFYVTAHRHVAPALQFRIVALVPFLLISILMAVLIFALPGQWKWSLSLFLFIHTTMCAGDFALLNFYHLRKGRKIFTWDDAEKRIAYFYEEI